MPSRAARHLLLCGVDLALPQQYTCSVSADASGTGPSRASAQSALEHCRWQLSPGALAATSAPPPGCQYVPGDREPSTSVLQPSGQQPVCRVWPWMGIPGSAPPRNDGGDKHQGASLPGSNGSPTPRTRAHGLIKPCRSSGAGGQSGTNLVFTQ